MFHASRLSYQTLKFELRFPLQIEIKPSDEVDVPHHLMQHMFKVIVRGCHLAPVHDVLESGRSRE